MLSPPHTKSNLKISDVSRLAGVSVSTLRVWEAQGMLTPAYTASGTRLYSERDIEAAAAIKRMRTVQGMKIPEIQAALRAMENGEESRPPAKVRPTGSEVGQMLRQLRQARGLKLKDVTAAIGVSTSVLASLERTSLGLDIPLMHRLAKFYGITLNEIMGVEPVPPDGETVMRGSGVVLPRLGVGLQIERLGAGTEIMDCQRWRVDPGVHSNGSYRHEGEEFLVVIAGQFEITLADERVHLLSAGDSIYFRSDLNHAWRNPGHTQTELIWVCVGNSF